MWLCLFLCLATSVAWLASSRWTMFFMAQFGDSYDLKAGCISHSWTSRPLREQLSARFKEPLELSWEWHRSPRKVPMEWWNPFYASTAKGRAMIILPLWIPFLLFAASSGMFYRLSRRGARLGCCTACGYDLRGLTPASRCPECHHGRSLFRLFVTVRRGLAPRFDITPPLSTVTPSTPVN